MSREEFRKKMLGQQTPTASSAAPAPNLGDLAAEQYKGGAEKIISSVKTGADRLAATKGQGAKGIAKGALALGEAGLGTAAGFVQGLFAPVTATLQKTADTTGVHPLEALMGSPAGKALNKWAEENPRLATDLMDAFAVGTTALGGQAGVLGKTASKMTVGDAAQSIKGAATDAFKMPGNIVKTLKGGPKSATEAMGQVLQGKRIDVSSAVRALSLIDTEGVKTYADLSQKLSKKVPILSRAVDSELAKDVKLYSLKELSKESKTAFGGNVNTDYVGRALQHLSEMYAAVGDDAAKANIDGMLEIAKTKGLTRQAVNDIARKYNIEFGEKAFSKRTGDALTSVNAEKYENTRKGLKDIARVGLGGEEAKAADAALSSIYNTKRLVDKMDEQVNKFRQRIEARGLGETIGHLVTKTADLLSGGVIRGAVGGVLPRGVGNKMLNALDLEEKLARNLELIRKVNAAKNDADFVSKIKRLERALTEQN